MRSAPGGSDPSLRVAALPRDHAKCAQAVVGVPTEAPTGQRRQRNTMGHTPTHTRNDIVILSRRFGPTTCYTCRPARYDPARTAYYYLTPTTPASNCCVFSTGTQTPLPSNVHAIASQARLDLEGEGGGGGPRTLSRNSQHEVQGAMKFTPFQQPGNIATTK